MLYVANRGSTRVGGPPGGPGSVSVLDWLNGNTVVADWPVPGGGSPDMGGVSADGKQLWLSGRYDNEVYVFDTTTGAVTVIPVGRRAARSLGVAPARSGVVRPHREHAVAPVDPALELTPIDFDCLRCGTIAPMRFRGLLRAVSQRAARAVPT